MTIAIMVAALSLATLFALVRQSSEPLGASQPTLSPADYAARILTQRYVRGQITAAEYERLLAIVRD